MTFLNSEILCLALGLVLLIGSNIGLGSITALIEGAWDEVKFRNGCIKGGVVAAALIAVYAAGYLNPDLLVIEVEGETVNLMAAVYAMLMAAYIAYAVDVLKKLYDLIIMPTPGAEDIAGAEEPMEIGFSLEKAGGTE